MIEQLEKSPKRTIDVGFDLEIEEDGWPPISTEILQALPLGDGKVRIDNTPFFVTSIALGDVVKVYRVDGENYSRCEELVEESGNYALSVILRDHASRDLIVQLLSKEGCFYEYGEFGQTKMYAISVTEVSAFEEIQARSDELEANGIISYAELCLA